MLVHINKILFVFALIYIVMPSGQAYAKDIASNNPKLLVSTEWLFNHLNDPALKILHVGKKDGYDDKHIPGALILSPADIIENEKNGLSHEMPSIKKLQDTFSSIGINNDSKIVIYYTSDQGIPLATRFFVTLEYLGFADKTFLLDGGIQKWLEEDRVVTDEMPTPEVGTITIQPNKDLMVNAKWVLGKLRDPNLIIIDARPEGQYNGREEDHNASRDGHITGAVNIPFYNLTKEDPAYIFKSFEELEKMFVSVGAVKSSATVIYCGSGFWAAPVYFAARYLGYKTYFFDGSYQEWSADKELPVTGPVKLNSF